METINILRLKNGEDIICYMEHYGADELVVRDPMYFDFKMDPRTGKTTIILDHWLPVYVLKSNETIIKESEVLAVLEGTSEFNTYYATTVSVMTEARNMKEEPSDSMDTSSSNDDELTSDDMNIILESMDTSKVQRH